MIFINDILIKQDYELIYLPNFDFIDIAIKASNTLQTDNVFGDKEIQNIEAISYNNIRIEKEISKYYIDGYNEFGLKKVISKFLNAPLEKININSNIGLQNVRFKYWE